MKERQDTLIFENEVPYMKYNVHAIVFAQGKRMSFSVP